MHIRIKTWDGLSYKVGTIANVSVSDMVALLGPSNYGDDLDKVSHSWRFYVDDEPINVWDWKGSCFMDRWSFYGHPATIAKLFGENNVQV
jgi:hypothetical protein